MPARTTRKEARARLLKTMMEALDRAIPEDESKPPKGSKFIDWENQATQFKQAVIPTLLEERAALENNARVADGGHCPHCGSNSVYLEKQTTTREVRGPDGAVLIPKQQCRRRSCGGSFSQRAGKEGDPAFALGMPEVGTGAGRGRRPSSASGALAGEGILGAKPSGAMMSLCPDRPPV